MSTTKTPDERNDAVLKRNFFNQPITPCESINMLGVEVVVKRDDLNHPVVQGNKLRKLKYNIQAAINAQAKTIVTFGGAYSNHLLATAFAAQQSGLAALGFVRGEELANAPTVWSDTLNHCHQLGMSLVFLSRSEYRLKTAARSVIKAVAELDSPFVLPEGGSNRLAMAGVAELVNELSGQIKAPSHIICPVGTGGTLAGLIQGVTENQWQSEVLGVAVLKGLGDVEQHIQQWLAGVNNPPKYKILHEFNGGGYARNTQELISFSLGFEQQTGIQLDKIYNNKSFYALAQLIKAKQITTTDTPLIIHTGGLQGGVILAKDLE